MSSKKGLRRASKDEQSLTLGAALRGLGLALGTSGTPRLDFRVDLRQRLVAEARLLALRPKPPPRPSRRRRSKGGGIKLAAIGIGFSLAGGGFAAAAHSLSLPAKPARQAVHGAPSAAMPSRDARTSEPAPVPRSLLASGHALAKPVAGPPHHAIAASTPSPDALAPAAVKTFASVLAQPSAVPTPAPTAPAAVPGIGVTLDPPLDSSPTQPPPWMSFVPRWLYPAPGLPAIPRPARSPLP